MGTTAQVDTKHHRRRRTNSQDMGGYRFVRLCLYLAGALVILKKIGLRSQESELRMWNIEYRK
jgi:hypothetical protein